ncbi:MAG: class I SAM-dependent methyltransferase [Alphaproteobacteria bacterium]
MASFAPLKNYVLRIMDGFIDAYGLHGPFLDAGCGQGDVALHLSKRGWEGSAIDFSPEAIVYAKEALKHTKVEVDVGDLMNLSGQYQTIVSCDVIEHVRDDQALLKKFHSLLLPQGWLILSVPTNPACEWRWDDEYYGHYRRYDRAALEKQLANNGFYLVKFYDCTFPFFWLMRRLYTLLPAKKPVSSVPEDNTAASSIQKAWELGFVSRLISALPIWWLVYALQKPFRNGKCGFEAVILARAI